MELCINCHYYFLVGFWLLCSSIIIIIIIIIKQGADMVTLKLFQDKNLVTLSIPPPTQLQHSEQVSKIKKRFQCLISELWVWNLSHRSWHMLAKFYSAKHYSDLLTLSDSDLLTLSVCLDPTYTGKFIVGIKSFWVECLKYKFQV